MKISYRAAATGVGAYTVLGDESDRTATIRDFRPTLQALVQAEPLLRATKQFVAGRGNRIWTVSFSVERTHASREAAVAFLASHPAALPKVVDLLIEQGATKVYLPAAVLTGFVPTPEGVATVCSYSFVGNDYTATAP